MSTHWYVIQTKPRQEELAKQHLQRQDYTVYLPMFKQKKRRRGKWVPVVEAMFPRYLFIQLTLYQDNFAPIRSTHGVSNIVRFGGNPAKVQDELINTLQNYEARLLGENKVRSEPLFKTGDAVQIVNGPFKGVQAIVQNNSAEERVILLLDILGRQNTICFESDDLVPVSA